MPNSLKVSVKIALNLNKLIIRNFHLLNEHYHSVDHKVFAAGALKHFSKNRIRGIDPSLINKGS